MFEDRPFQRPTCLIPTIVIWADVPGPRGFVVSIRCVARCAGKGKWVSRHTWSESPDCVAFLLLDDIDLLLLFFDDHLACLGPTASKLYFRNLPKTNKNKYSGNPAGQKSHSAGNK